MRKELVGFLVFFFVFGMVSEAFAGVWDPRDPEIVRAEAMVQGVDERTIVYMQKWELFLNVWIHTHSLSQLKLTHEQYRARLIELSLYARGLRKDPELGKTISTDHPKLVQLYGLIKKANEPMFILMQGIVKEASKNK